MPLHRRPCRLVIAAALGIAAAASASAPARAADPSAGAFAHSQVAAVEELEEQRGRFLLPNGAMLDLVVSSTQIVNGQTVSSFQLNTAGLDLNPAVAALAARGLHTTLQNSLDGAVIRNVNSLTLNYTRPSVPLTGTLTPTAAYQSVLSLVAGR